LCALALRSVSTADLVAEALVIALAYDVTAYDACYVALAQQIDAPLVTADESLVRKLAGTAYDVRWLGNVFVPPLPSDPSPSTSP
jgi:predicted nucleic acid-binding protein